MWCPRNSPVRKHCDPASSCRGSLAAPTTPIWTAGWKATMHGLYAALDQLGVKVLQAIALDLGLPETFFDETV